MQQSAELHCRCQYGRAAVSPGLELFAVVNTDDADENTLTHIDEDVIFIH
jgi:hypothetical protein